MAYEHLGDTFNRWENVAVGGSSQCDWMKGTPYYNNLLNCLKIDPKEAVLLWWQGETEGLYGPTDTWRVNFETMVANLRADVGINFPVVFVQIGQTTLGNDHNDWLKVQAQQEQATTEMLNTWMVQSKDMFPEGDGQIHYSQAQYDIMQQRMLTAYTEGGSHATKLPTTTAS